jgi:hypothetical protein
MRALDLSPSARRGRDPALRDFGRRFDPAMASPPEDTADRAPTPALNARTEDGWPVVVRENSIEDNPYDRRFQYAERDDGAPISIKKG